MGRNSQYIVSREDKYPKLVRALMPYEKNIVLGSLTKDILEVVASDVWKDHRKARRIRLGTFIRFNEQSILQHIAELKINKDAVVLHKQVQKRESRLESVAVAMISHKEFLQTDRLVPITILRGLSQQLDSPRNGRTKVAALQGFIRHNRNALLKRIYEIDKGAKENLNPSSEEKRTEENSGLGKHSVSTSLVENQEDPKKKNKDPKLTSPAKSHLLPSRKRCRGDEDDEERLSTTSPCPKRRHLSADDLAFARWCLQKIRPRF